MSAKGFGVKPPSKIDKLIEQAVRHAQALAMPKATTCGIASIKSA
jgi:hypothetical protein